MPKPIFILVVGVCGFLANGCGSQTKAKVEVKGIVYFRGEPIKGGMIVFTPDPERGSQGPLAKAMIGSDGRFALSADEAAAISPGWYRVAIADQGSAVPTARNPYPGPSGKYRNPDLSGLLREVKPGAENNFEFQLTES